MMIFKMNSDQNSELLNKLKTIFIA